MMFVKSFERKRVAVCILHERLRQASVRRCGIKGFDSELDCWLGALTGSVLLQS